MTRHRATWTAAEDGIAHLTIPGTHRTACGRVPVALLWAWPTLTHCPTCRVATRPEAPR
jgi:hypothetical protein